MPALFHKTPVTASDLFNEQMLPFLGHEHAEIIRESWRSLKIVEINPRNLRVGEFKVHCFAEFHPIAQMRAHSDGCSRLPSQQYWLTVVCWEHFFEK